MHNINTIILTGVCTKKKTPSTSLIKRYPVDEFKYISKYEKKRKKKKKRWTPERSGTKAKMTVMKVPTA